MKKNKTVWLVLILSCAAVLLSAVGLLSVFAAPKDQAKIQTKQPETAKQEKQSDTFRLTALGDSLTYGVGDQEGAGYVGIVEKKLQKSGLNPLKINLAISGAKSNGLLEQLRKPDVVKRVQDANLIVMTIGGNDLFRGGAALTDFKTETANQAETVYLKNLRAIYERIRKLNSKANVYHVGLYHPFAAEADGKEMGQVVAKWNFDTAKLAGEFERIIFVPTYDLLELDTESYLASDHFHPNHAGYTLIGNRLAEVLKAGGVLK
ncbi:lipase/acylhydrolase [Listeria floridensis FSL S10-1187]|uniref:Lipase/acylhydrolase n=1 Tax=Listeria floridensis FSL S10-1187 TaxID=1265817 RepID=A0ABP3AWQ5_9LIST|nr:SGNH/GDSL hydrolase family protein [Listeria floridensis]EUJ30305.1 lipase/acylhydrolase [Listeria floridensis FSL S10-1187]